VERLEVRAVARVHLHVTVRHLHRPVDRPHRPAVLRARRRAALLARRHRGVHHDGAAIDVTDVVVAHSVRVLPRAGPAVRDVVAVEVAVVHVRPAVRVVLLVARARRVQPVIDEMLDVHVAELDGSTMVVLHPAEPLPGALHLAVARVDVLHHARRVVVGDVGRQYVVAARMDALDTDVPHRPVVALGDDLHGRSRGSDVDELVLPHLAGIDVDVLLRVARDGDGVVALTRGGGRCTCGDDRRRPRQLQAGPAADSGAVGARGGLVLASLSRLCPRPRGLGISWHVLLQGGRLAVADLTLQIPPIKKGVNNSGSGGSKVRVSESDAGEQMPLRPPYTPKTPSAAVGGRSLARRYSIVTSSR